jgi:hypothetical protein
MVENGNQTVDFGNPILCDLERISVLFEMAF